MIYMTKKKNIILVLAFLCLFTGIFLFQASLKPQEAKKEEPKSRIADTIVIEEQKTEEEISNGEKILQYRTEYNNQEVVGELQIPNTSLVVPVLQSDDNKYYLDHLPDKTKNSLGSVFLDYRNNVDDRKIILYGHNSETIETDFHLLENYVNPTYYSDHNIILFQTENKLYRYQIFSVYIATQDYQHVNLNFTDETYAAHLAWLKKQSLYDTGVGIVSTDEIIVLQTCYFEPVGSYLIVVGKKI